MSDETPKVYVIDTNTLIGFSIWNPIALNSHFWTKLEEALKEKRWILLDVVVEEIKYNKPLEDWCKKQKKDSLVTEITENDRNYAVEINNKYPMIDQTTFKSTVDTYLISYAVNNKVAIFTREIQKTTEEDLYKIPDVCGILQVECTKKPQDFLESIDFKN